MTERNNMIDLLEKSSKHSSYQVIPKCITHLVDSRDLKIESRWECERLDYIMKYVDPRNKTFLDIGGNTGFFSFELIERGASKVLYYEGNIEHATFVKEAAKLTGVEDKLIVNDEYFDFLNFQVIEKVDVIFLLNVLHHIGDDFGDNSISIEQAKKQIMHNVNSLTEKCDMLAMQIGFNWKGDIKYPLFKNGTKKEMISYLESNILEDWEIVEIGIPEQIEQKIKYKSVNNKNLNRDDKLGEFLNRPIFILKSKN